MNTREISRLYIRKNFYSFNVLLCGWTFIVTRRMGGTRERGRGAARCGESNSGEKCEEAASAGPRIGHRKA